jgi:putative phosphoesterase
MKKIGLLSDTHSHLDESVFQYLAPCQEIWHAGDIGDPKIADRLESFRPLRAVYGNIDGLSIQHRFPLDLRFECEGVDVFMTHIGGYPGKYFKRVKDILFAHPPKLFICGHSHILKVIPDKQLGLLHMNPGACGNEGWHKVKTLLRFDLNSGRIENLEVVELGIRGEGRYGGVEV